MSRFVIDAAAITFVEPKVSRNGTNYWNIHFTMMVTGKTGNKFPKQANIACFDAQTAQSIVVGQTYDLKGELGASQEGYLRLFFKTATPVGGQAAAPAQQYAPQPAGQPQPVAQQPVAQPAQAAPQYAPMPQPAQAAPPQAQPQPSNDFDDDIPF